MHPPKSKHLRVPGGWKSLEVEVFVGGWKSLEVGGSLWRWKSLEVRKAASKIFFPLQTRTLRAGVNLRSVSDKFKYKYINTNPKIHTLKNTMVPWFPFSAFCRSPFVVIICRLVMLQHQNTFVM